MADTPAHGAESAGHPADAHGASETFPPFDPTYFSSQLFWLAITFVVLYLVMSRLAIPRIGAVIEERRDKIADDLDRAAELKLESEAAVAAYEKALADAKAKAAAIAAETREKLDAEIAAMQANVDAQLDEKLVAAEARIAESKAEALGHIREIAAETGEAIVAQLIGAHADDGAALAAAIDAEIASQSHG